MKTLLLTACLLVFEFANAQNLSSCSAPAKVAPEKSLEFIPNKGQIADMKGRQRGDILYISHAGNMEVYLRNKGLSYVISTLKNPKLTPGYVDDDPPGEEVKDSHENKLKLRNEPFKTCRIDMDFVDAAQPSTENVSPTDGYLNYYFPQCPNGATKVKAYQNIIYKGIYPGIDVSYMGTYDKGLKYNLIVNAGGDPDKIRMKYTGAEKVEIKDGKLLLTAYTGKMEERIPKIYQEINGVETNVVGEYTLYHQGKDSADGTIVGIKINNYNKAYPLVIDPWWASYCGGSTDDEAYACALDKLGNTLAAGVAESANFPVSVGAFQTTLSGSEDAFIIKFDRNGQRLWATYYDGSSFEGAYGITTDIHNNVLVTGYTESSNFPVSAGAFQTIFGGTEDAFLIKFNPNGLRQWATYCGGSSDDFASGVTTDLAGNIAIAGRTSSTNFPVTGGAFQTNLAGYENPFVVKFDSNGHQLWGTYFGGSADDEAYSICADANGNIAFCGYSNSANFPVSPGAFQTTPDAGFIAELDATGHRLWATYYGGYGNGCAIDRSNNVIVAGYAFLNGTIVATPGVYQSAYTSGRGYAVKFSPGGNRIWATFNNTMQSEGGDFAVAVDEGNNVYLEDDEEPPSVNGTSCAFQSNFANSRECLLIVKLDSNAHFACSTYADGTIYDEHEYTSANLAVRNGRMALAGYTSGGIPTTSGAFQTTYPGGTAYSPYVINLCSFACGDTTPPALSVSKILVKSTSCLGYATFSARSTATCDSGGAIFQWSFPGGYPSSAIGPSISNVVYSNPGTYTATLKYIACSIDSISQTFTISSAFHDSLVVVNPKLCTEKGKATAYPISGISPYTYWWSNGKYTQSDTGLIARTYTCIVTGNNGCKDTTVFQVKDPVGPPFVSKPHGDTGFCAGGSVALLVTGGTNFMWSPSYGLSCTSCPNPIANPAVDTTYTVTGIDSLGCPSSTTIKVVSDTNHFRIYHYSNCTYTEVEVYGYYANLVKVKWSPASDVVCDSCAYTTTQNITTPVTFTVTVTDQYGCTRTDTVTVDPPPDNLKVTATIQPDSICAGDSALLTFTVNKYVLFHDWFAGYPARIRCDTCASTYLVDTVPGLYRVEMEVEDSTRCISYVDLTILVSSKPDAGITISQRDICIGQKTLLIASGQGSYLWSTGQTTDTISVSPSSTASYSLTVNNGCKATDTAIVNVHTISALQGINVCCNTSILGGQTVQLSATGAGAGVTYFWSPDYGLSCDNCPDPVASPPLTTTYTVTVSDSGCSVSDIVTIDVNCGDVFVPDAFSPNRDGHNDVLYVRGLCISTLYFAVFDRWGNKVFDTSTPTIGWDGYHNGLPMNTGTYVWFLKATLLDGTHLERKGNVALVR